MTNEITLDYSGFSIAAWVMGAVLPMSATGEWSPSPYLDIPTPVLYRYSVNCMVYMHVKYRISALTKFNTSAKRLLSTCFRLFFQCIPNHTFLTNSLKKKLIGKTMILIFISPDCKQIIYYYLNSTRKKQMKKTF